MGKKIIQKSARFFTEEERHQVIQEYLSLRCSKREIWHKYTGQTDERGHLLRWMRELGYDTESKLRNVTIVSRQLITSMDEEEKHIASGEKSFETIQLEKRIAQLEQQLKDAELKAIAFSTMVDIAEKEFKIPIRKKLNTKP